MGVSPKIKHSSSVEKEMVKLGSQGMSVGPLGRIQTFQGEGIACALIPRLSTV